MLYVRLSGRWVRRGNILEEARQVQLVAIASGSLDDLYMTAVAVSTSRLANH